MPVLPSGFTAVPNPLMLGFMTMQSYMMMLAAGEAWQYGKRRISALSNDEFNKLAKDDRKFGEMIAKQMKEMQPIIEESLTQYDDLVPVIVKEMAEFAKRMVETAPEAVGQFTGISEDNQLGENLLRALSGAIGGPLIPSAFAEQPGNHQTPSQIPSEDPTNPSNFNTQQRTTQRNVTEAKANTQKPSKPARTVQSLQREKKQLDKLVDDSRHLQLEYAKVFEDKTMQTSRNRKDIFTIKGPSESRRISQPGEANTSMSATRLVAARTARLMHKQNKKAGIVGVRTGTNTAILQIWGELPYVTRPFFHQAKNELLAGIQNTITEGKKRQKQLEYEIVVAQNR